MPRRSAVVLQSQKYRTYIGWLITSVGIAFQHPDAFARISLLIMNKMEQQNEHLDRIEVLVKTRKTNI